MYTKNVNDMRMPQFELSSLSLPGIADLDACVGGGEIVISERVQEARAAYPMFDIESQCNRSRLQETPRNTPPYGYEGYEKGES